MTNSDAHERGYVRGRLLMAVVAATALVAAAVGFLLADGAGSPSASPSVGPQPSATATPETRPRTPSVSPLTGLPARAGRPVLTVKIDNVRPARPPSGLTKADVVYVEPVEGGLSRLLAVFSSSLPRTVGPVRSARESDLELLRQYGRPAFAFSGANSGVLRIIRRAPVVDVSPPRAGRAYDRSNERRAPHNLFAEPAQLLRRASGASGARDIGFRFGALPPGGTPTTSHEVRYAAASTGFRWRNGRWLVDMDRRPATTAEGPQLAASTVVVQHVEIEPSRFRDGAGNVTPYPRTVGSGTALVLRDGTALQARWSRPDADSGTRFTTTAGGPMPFAPGQVWVVLAEPPRGG